MSIESQIKTFTNAIFFAAQLFGLWPYTIDATTHHIKYNRLKLIYSIVLPAIIVYCHETFGVEVLASSRSSNVVPSETMNVTVQLYGMITLASFTQLYVGQHLQFGSLKSVYLKFFDVVDILKTIFTESTKLGPYYVKFFIKTIFFDIFNLLALWHNLKKSSDVTTTHPYLPLVLHIPAMIVKLYENIFYGGILIFHVVLKLINKKLVKMMTTIETCKLCRKSNIETYCQLSDEMDKLSNFYLKLSETIKAFNSIFDIHVSFFMAQQLSALLIRCFYQYVEIVFLLNSHGNYGFLVSQNFITFVVTMTSWTEILLTSSACESLVAEVTHYCTI